MDFAWNNLLLLTARFVLKVKSVFFRCKNTANLVPLIVLFNKYAFFQIITLALRMPKQIKFTEFCTIIISAVQGAHFHALKSREPKSMHVPCWKLLSVSHTRLAVHIITSLQVLQYLRVIRAVCYCLVKTCMQGVTRTGKNITWSSRNPKACLRTDFQFAFINALCLWYKKSFLWVKKSCNQTREKSVEDVLFGNTERNSADRFGIKGCITIFIPDALA